MRSWKLAARSGTLTVSPFIWALFTSLSTAVFRPEKLTLYLPSTWGTGRR